MSRVSAVAGSCSLWDSHRDGTREGSRLLRDGSGGGKAAPWQHNSIECDVRSKRQNTVTMPELVWGHECSKFNCPKQQIQSKLNERISTVLGFHVFYSADRLSTRKLRSVWCVSGTRGVKWNGTVPGVTSEEFLVIFTCNKVFCFSCFSIGLHQILQTSFIPFENLFFLHVFILFKSSFLHSCS